MAEKTIDCVVCGSCVVDLLVRPVPLNEPIGAEKLVRVAPIEATVGGIVSNSGTAMARLGLNVAAFTYLGDDDWAPIIRSRYEREGIDTAHLLTHPTQATSTTAVLIDEHGERSFAHCVGAPKFIDKAMFDAHLDLFARSRAMLIGYYSLMPNLENDLAHVLATIRAAGCKTALDAAGDGGAMRPLDQLLPHLDVYVPSFNEAHNQTGERDPKRIIDAFHSHGGPAGAWRGVKLGSKGALLSNGPGVYVPVDVVVPPGDVVDTTGAGDSFYAGLLTGLLKDMPIEKAGKLAAATGSCCITAAGATTGLRDYAATAKLAGL